MKRIRTGVAACVAALLAAGPCAAASAPATEKLSLKLAEDTAVINHPQVSAALLSALATNEVIRETRAAYFPTLWANVTTADAATGTRLAAGALNNPTVFDRNAVGLAASQLLTDFGRTARLVASARMRAQADARSVDFVRADVLVQVDVSYLAALKARAVLEVARDTLNLRSAVFDQVSQLASNKLRGGLDVSVAKVALDDARLLVSRTENEQEAARSALALAMGVAEAPLALEDLPLPPAPEKDPGPLIREALAIRSDLAALRLGQGAAVEFARAEADLTNPTITAFGNAGLVDGDPKTFREPYSAVAVNVTVPVFNGGLFSARKKEARLRADLVGQRVRDLENRIANDVRVAWLNARTAFERLGLAADQMTAATEAYDLTQGRYTMGLSSIVDLAQAQAALTAARILDSSARYDALTQLAVLRHHIGRPR